MYGNYFVNTITYMATCLHSDEQTGFVGENIDKHIPVPPSESLMKYIHTTNYKQHHIYNTSPYNTSHARGDQN